MENQYQNLDTDTLDKRTKEYKARQQVKTPATEGVLKYANSNYEALKENGIQIKTAVFARAVNYPNLEPVTAFYSEDPAVKPYKKASMWLTPYGLICEQKDKRMIVPLANVLFTLPL